LRALLAPLLLAILDDDERAYILVSHFLNRIMHGLIGLYGPDLATFAIKQVSHSTHRSPLILYVIGHLPRTNPLNASDLQFSIAFFAFIGQSGFLPSLILLIITKNRVAGEVNQSLFRMSA